MHIAYLSTMGGFYGGEVHLASLARGMQDRGHEVTCVVRPGSQLHNRLPGMGLAVAPLPLVHWYEPVQMTRLALLLRGLGVEILHSHVPRDYYMAAMACSGGDIINVGTRHQLYPIRLPLLKRPFLGRFKVMIAVSEAVRSSLIQSRVLDSSRIVTVPNGIALAPGIPAQQPAVGPLRLACGAAAGDPVVGYVGRLCPTKGVETLIEAASEMRPSWPRLKVCIVGQEDGRNDYLGRLREMVRQRNLEPVVHFLGYRDDAARAGREFNVQVIPSQSEPFGLVTLEGMAQGRPVVVTNTGGSPEIVRDGVEGFLVRPGDASQLARRLEVLLESPGLCREMGSRGRLRVEQEFNLDLMLNRTEIIYRQALGRSDVRQEVASA